MTQPIANVPESPRAEFEAVVKACEEFFEALEGEVDEEQSKSADDMIFKPLPATGYTSMGCINNLIDQLAEAVLSARWGVARCKLHETDKVSYGPVRATSQFLQRLELELMETGTALVILRRQLEEVQKPI